VSLIAIATSRKEGRKEKWWKGGRKGLWKEGRKNSGRKEVRLQQLG
jgi:hypothetical protein